MPNLVTYLDHTLIFKWYVVRCDSNDKCQKGIIMCLKESELHAQNMILTILGSIDIGGPI